MRDCARSASRPCRLFPANLSGSRPHRSPVGDERLQLGRGFVHKREISRLSLEQCRSEAPVVDQLCLYVLPPSHYCERARWALDHMGLTYQEDRWAVGVHIPLARRIAKGTTLPILTTGQEVIQGSGSILDWTGMPGGAPALEQRFEKRIGVLVRQFIYAGTLGAEGAGVRDVLFQNVPAGQARLGRLMWPITRRLMVAGMNARPALLPELEQKLTAELEWFEDQLAGGWHLVGDRFGRADLTAASLLGPLARPAACPLYRKVRLPDKLEKTLTLWSGRQSLRWAERIYAIHRHGHFVSTPKP